MEVLLKPCFVSNRFQSIEKHRLGSELLERVVPGFLCDIWRKPNRQEVVDTNFPLQLYLPSRDLHCPSRFGHRQGTSKLSPLLYIVKNNKEIFRFSVFMDLISEKNILRSGPKELPGKGIVNNLLSC